MSGIRTPDLPTRRIIDSLIGNDANGSAKIDVASLAAQLNSFIGPAFQTRAELFADLDWPAETRAMVYGDENADYIGTYQKSGQPGAGAWTRIGDLPPSAIGMNEIQALKSSKADKSELNTTQTIVTELRNEKADKSALLAEQQARISALAAEQQARLTGMAAAGAEIQQLKDNKVDNTVLAATERTLSAGMRLSPNFFDAGSRIEGYAVSETTGELLQGAAYDASGWIWVKGNRNYRFSTIHRLAWYDEDKNFISGEVRPVGTEPLDRVSPPGAGFARLSLPNDGSVDIDAFMMTLVSEWPPTPVPFGLVPDLEKVRMPTDRLNDWWAEGYLRPDRNLIDENTSEIGVFINSETGALTTKALYRASALISVDPETTYSISGGVESSVGARSVAQYAADGSLIPTPMASVPPLYMQTFSTGPETAFVRITYHQSADGRVQLERGAAATAYARFARVPVLPGGTPLAQRGGRPDSHGLARLREARTRLAAYRLGLAGRDAQLHIGLLGDSWMMVPNYYGRHLSRSIWGRLTGPDGYSSDTGPIGLGYQTFRNSNDGPVRNSTRFNVIGAPMTISGNWSEIHNLAASASINGQQSSDVGAYVEWEMNYSLTPAREHTLHALGGAGALRYRWTEAGPWSEIDLAARPAGLVTIPLTGQPSSGSGLFRLEVLAGNVSIHGLMEVAPDAPGVVISNLGGSGSTSNHWATQAASADFVTAIAATDCDLFEITLGTNDALSGVSQAMFARNIRYLVERIREGRPTADILLSAPSQNADFDGRVTPVAIYAEAMYQLSLEMDVAFIDLQASFGTVASSYAPGSARPYFNDEVHPGQLGALSRASRLMDAIGI